MHGFIFANAGPTAGLGHLRRCLVLARALAEQGCSIELAVPEEGRAALRNVGGGESVAEPSRSSYDLAIWDSYDPIPEAWAAAITSARISVVIDDEASHPLTADIVVNPNFAAERLDYQTLTKATVLAGLGYALADPAFYQCRSYLRRHHLLVAFGGTDDGTFGVPVAEQLLVRQDLPVILVLSPLRAMAPTAAALAARFPDRLEVKHGANMVEVMKRAGFYVGACGSTVWEAAMAGLDLALVAISENQRPSLERLKALQVAGLHAFDPVKLAELAVVRLRQATLEPSPLSRLLDGQGPRRVASYIAAQVKS